MSLKLFTIRVTNPATGETARFIGQGETLSAALKDGTDSIGKPFRPKQDGRTQTLNTLTVELPDGRTVNRTVKEFESDTPFPP